MVFGIRGPLKEVFVICGDREEDRQFAFAFGNLVSEGPVSPLERALTSLEDLQPVAYSPSVEFVDENREYFEARGYSLKVFDMQRYYPLEI